MAEQLKIAVYHNLPSGGAKRALFEITRRLGARHHLDLYVLSCADRAFCDVRAAMRQTFTYRFAPLPHLSWPIGRLNFAARLIDLLRLGPVQRRIARDLDARGYDVVYVSPCQFTQTPALLRWLRTPTLYHAHEPLRQAYEPAIDRPYATRRGARRLLDRMDVVAATYQRRRAQVDRAALRRASLILTCSNFTYASLHRIYGVNAYVCYNGVDTETFRPLAIARDGGALSVGALRPNKGFDFVLRSLACVPAALRPALTIISNEQGEDERRYVESLAAAEGVTLRLRCNVSDDALCRAYNQAAVVVYAPVQEPFGLVPLEAMACGTPVVAVAEAGVRESVLHERTGVLVERDVACAAAAVQRLLGNPAMAMEYGRNGREDVLQRWTWDRTVMQLEEHLASCAAIR